MKDFRVYFVEHAEQRISGTLMERYQVLFRKPLAAIGQSEQEVLAQLEDEIIEERSLHNDHFERFLWDEDLDVQVIRCDVHPLTAVGDNKVIGAQRIPLRLSYAFSKLARGGYRIMLPRFGFRFIVQDLSIAAEVVRQAVEASLAGEAGAWLYSYRNEGQEYVRRWSTQLSELAVRRFEHADEGAFPVLAEIAEEWAFKAGARKLEPCVGLDAAFETHVPLLLADPPPSILLVGPAGVGKSTFVRRLARLLVDVKRGKRGERRGIRLWATSADRIIAGMAYLGMWQQRCIELVEELSGEGDYLYVDRLADIMQSQPDGASIADILAPAVLAGDVSLIAECDERELARLRRKHSLVDAMVTIRLQGHNRAALTELMKAYLARMAPSLTLRDDAYRRVLSHLAAFRPDQSLTGTCFQFFSWLARQTMQLPDASRWVDPAAPAPPPALRAPSASVEPTTRAPLSAMEISQAFSRYSGLPMDLLSDDIAADAATIARKLAARVIGQDQACEVSARVIARLKAGLNDPERPLGTLFFVGPTGVGKTELAKQLAAFMYGSADRLVRLDMSEFGAPGSAQRLLWVGPRQRSLAQRVREQPMSVVLFDEIEKAHSEVFDMLLSVLDEGRLSDSQGRLVDMRMTLIVMTSNLGASDARSVGFGGSAERDYRRAVMQHFRPELFNRIDHVVSFERLPLSAVEQIVDLEIAALQQRSGMLGRGLRIRLEPAARQQLARLGYRPDMGARPLKRVIEERVVAPLSVRMAADPQFRDRAITVSLASDNPDNIVI